MQKTWVISDTHFGHKNIIDYCNRPFKSVEEMDEVLINNWNSVVKNKQLVYVLGDFAVCSPTRISEILSKLNGTKHLIMGNHDRRKTPTWWRRVGFDEVSKFPILIFHELENMKGKYFDTEECKVETYKVPILLTHEPLFKKGLRSIFGHVHNKCEQVDNRSISKYFDYNACVEVNNYKPVALDYIIKQIL